LLRILVSDEAVSARLDAAVRDRLVEWLVEKPWRPGEVVKAVRHGIRTRR
jgi:hypothetical protein